MDLGMFITGGMLLLLSVILFWPEREFYFRWNHRHRLARETIEDGLMHLHQRQHDGRLASTESTKLGHPPQTMAV